MTLQTPLDHNASFITKWFLLFLLDNPSPPSSPSVPHDLPRICATSKSKFPRSHVAVLDLPFRVMLMPTAHIACVLDHYISTRLPLSALLFLSSNLTSFSTSATTPRTSRGSSCFVDLGSSSYCDVQRSRERESQGRTANRQRAAAAPTAACEEMRKEKEVRSSAEVGCQPSLGPGAVRVGVGHDSVPGRPPVVCLQ